MKNLATIPAWGLIKTQLKRRYRQLTDADLADAERQGDGWLMKVHQIIGGPLFELAHFVEEVTEQVRTFPALRVRVDQPRAWA